MAEGEAAPPKGTIVRVEFKLGGKNAKERSAQTALLLLTIQNSGHLESVTVITPAGDELTGADALEKWKKVIKHAAEDL